MQDDAESSEGDDEGDAGPSDQPMEDDSLQCFEGHGGLYCWHVCSSTGQSQATEYAATAFFCI